MADEQQLERLRQGVKVWNKWREEHPEAKVDLSGAFLLGLNLSGVNLFNSDLSNAQFSFANLSEANLSRANLINAYLDEADFSNINLSGVVAHDANLFNTNLFEANLSEANFYRSNFSKANLSKALLSRANLSEGNLSEANLTAAILERTELNYANLKKANLSGAVLSTAWFLGADLSESDLRNADLRAAVMNQADLSDADLSGANLTGASLERVNFVETKIEKAVFKNCSVYGVNVWSLKGIPKNQSNLILYHADKVHFIVDDLQVAQFIFLMLDRGNLRNILNTITSKAVLILGRFTPDRKEILEAMADELRKYNLMPIIFDFERPSSRDFAETIKALAGLCLFIIADITNPKSAPLELQATVPDYQIPFVTIIKKGEEPFSMLSDLGGKYDWVLQPVITYSSKKELLAGFERGILNRAWEKHKELQEKKTNAIKTQSITDFLSDA